MVIQSGRIEFPHDLRYRKKNSQNLLVAVNVENTDNQTRTYAAIQIHEDYAKSSKNRESLNK